MTSSDAWPERVMRVANHVQSHLDDDLDPGDLAALAGLSRHHFHRVFRGMTGESVMGFVRRLRLERAAQQLKYSTQSVTDLAFASGYGSHEAFTRAFRSRFGVPPAEFRRQDDTEIPAVDCELRDEPARVAYALRHVGSYDDCGAAWQALYGWAASVGVLGRERGGLGLCYDDPDITAHPRLRYDACLVVDPADATSERLSSAVAIRRVPAGRYAFAVHRGPYETIHSTYLGLLGRWLPHRGIELADEPVVEVYLNSPMTTAPADLVTEVCVRLR